MLDWVLNTSVLHRSFSKKFPEYLSISRVTFQAAEAATGGDLLKNVFLEISQNSQENTCVRPSFLIKLQASGLQLFL